MSLETEKQLTITSFSKNHIHRFARLIGSRNILAGCIGIQIQKHIPRRQKNGRGWILFGNVEYLIPTVFRNLKVSAPGIAYLSSSKYFQIGKTEVSAIDQGPDKGSRVDRTGSQIGWPANGRIRLSVRVRCRPRGSDMDLPRIRNGLRHPGPPLLLDRQWNQEDREQGYDYDDRE